MDLWVEATTFQGEKSLVNLKQITEITIGNYEGENIEEICRVLIRYDTTSKARTIYSGTQVECLRIYDALTEKLNPLKLEPWEQSHK